MRVLAALRWLLIAAAGMSLAGQVAQAQTVPGPNPITNTNPAFVWTIQPVPPQQWDGRRALPLRVYVGARPATQVRLLPPDMIEPERHRPLRRTFLLCETETGPCNGAPIASLEAGKITVLWARPHGEEVVAAGTYAVTFHLVAAERAEGDKITTSLYVSRDDLRIVGGALVFLGVVIAYLVTRVMRQRAERNAMLRPAAFLVDEIGRLKNDRGDYKGTLAGFDAAVANLEESLAIDRVSRYLPSSWDFFPAPASVPTSGETYQAFLTRTGNEIGSLAIILNSGILAAERERTNATNPAMVGIIDRTVAELDALAGGILPAPDAAATAVRDKLATMQAELNQARGVKSDEPPAPPAVGYSSRQLATQSAVLNLGAWLVFALLSTLVGIYMLVLRDNDFGQPQDLLFCLLWGFGLPTAAQGVSGLTNANVAQSFGVTLTRPGQ